MRGDLNENIPPTTRIALESINRTGENRLNSNVRLSWFGSDKDGYVVGYEISLDNEQWHFTTSTDSTFRFSITPGSDTTDQDFWVRAIDNEDARDPEPAFLRIPLRNTPPEASFDNDVGPKDTAFIAATLRWRATDLDGDETIESVQMKFNDGDWFEIPSANLITFVLEENATGVGEALIYAGVENTPRTIKANDVRIDAINNVYIKAIDIAGAESEIDTSAAFYFKQSASRNLIICGQPASVRDVIMPYARNAFQNDYEFLDFFVDQGSRQPRFWQANFARVMERIDKLYVFTDISTFTNPASGQSASILVNLAPLISQFNANNGKSLVTTILTPASDIDGLSVGFPIEDVVRSGGQARLTGDSSLVPSMSGYPILNPDGTITGIVPIVKSIDSENFYRAQITPLNNWSGDNLMGSLRRRNGNIQQIFIAISLHRFVGNSTNLQQFFDKIIQDDFDW
ncbi:MAG: hypothetical protein LAT54_08950 [Cryomorphaceae bacterium]|nr:hypothetical protein [Cryomorphaceae bacterium]